ncbi:MAG: DNA polymerase III subunit gamma/tau [Saprospiraceae bacterium]|jgi:DNA polymerase-3 subunit gamma/tau|nr:DNA polymerase III subunit gamma/tau [Saprospiraceae bacterium]
MSNFIVSARKYRPTTFDEVVGQDHVSKTLKNALQTDHLAHAFLFTGPRGVGKTTCARILAKIINCHNPINKVEACNHCSSCTSFNDNSSFNILELDGASNNSVDNIRNLIEQVRFQPQNGKYKVFIIDEVHMLSQSAFNAFLKTLEEPPSYVIFILATTEKHKIIPTILSRCQIFDFKRIQLSDTVTQLEKIALKEGIKADKEALHTIAIKSDGAMRDALTIFDKIASSVGNIITYKDVVANLNLLDYEYYFKMTDAFLREDISSVLLSLNEIVKLGFDAEHFVVGLADHFRDLLIAKSPATLSILEQSDALKQRYQNQAILAKSSFLLSGLNILNKCDVDLLRAKNKRLQVELALSKLAFLNRSADIEIFGSNPESQEKKTEILTENEFSEKKLNEEIITKSDPTSDEISNQTQRPVEREHGNHINETQPAAPQVIRISDIESIKATIKKAEEAKAETRKNISLELVHEIWKTYSDHNPSKSVQSALNLAILTLNNNTIFIKIPTQVSKEMIMQESSLLEKLREELGINDLKIEIEIDKSLFPDFEEAKPVLLMSQKEKYLLMLEKNPGLGAFTKKLGLKLDTEV